MISLSINLKFYFCGVHAASFVFPLTCAAEKHIISEKPLNKRFFKGTGVVLAGIECSPKIFDFRASGIPVQERVDFFDTLCGVCIANAVFIMSGEKYMEYEIRRSARKTVALEITDRAALLVRAPLKMSDREIERFVLKYSDWVEEKLKTA